MNMTIIEILCLATALAMDAFSVSVSSGMNSYCNAKNAIKMAFMFGLFQFIMPLAGNGAALLFVEYTKRYSPLIVATVLAFVGARMIWEAVRSTDKLPSNPFSLPSMLALAFATSVDALAAGISIGTTDTPVMLPAVIIGVVAALFSLLGICIGRFTKRLIPFPAGILGGIILILIAVKSLIEFII